ncbi:MAG TPA: CCXG family PEP-CTERM protein [Myxococcota bacterium]|nr:CCXG family PEP-CTERM protein [Myxococcota bacterium]
MDQGERASRETPRAPTASRRRRSPAWLIMAIVAIGLSIATGSAQALSFRADFVSSTYQVQTGDTIDDLLREHRDGTPIRSSSTTGLENISTAVYADGVTTDYGILLSTTLEVGVSGTFTFQVGTDWGRGGGTALIDDATGSVLSERILTEDIWWNGDWNHPDVFTTTFDLQAGDSVTLVWVGFEGCCGGSSTLRFSVDGGGFQPLTQASLEPFAIVPEPGTALLLGLGLLTLPFARRSGRAAS